MASAARVFTVDGFTDDLLALIAREDNPVGLLIIALSAAVEYVFPPFPGDTITLFAAALITAYGWSFWAVFGAVMSGSVAGSMAAFYAGGWLRRRRSRKRAADTSERAALDRLVARFHRHGAAYLMVNRFLPGLRALFFVAAGLADMRPWAVAGYSAVSAAVWNLAIIAAGSTLGANADTLTLWVERYTVAVWLVIGGVVVVWTALWLIRRRAARAHGPTDADADSHRP